MESLSPDEASRTNELLANLTEIIIQLNAGVIASNLNFSRPEPFVPDVSDVRVNACWFIALVLSVCHSVGYFI